jgi:hypothetical protein
MSGNYFFSIQGKSAGPFDDEAIRDHIANGRITRDTLVWRDGMPGWQPLKEVAELVRSYGPILRDASRPPPLPQEASAAPGAPPPLPGEGAAAGSATGPVTGNHGRDDIAYRFVTWMYRPRRGGHSRVCDYVEEDPTRALPVAALTMLAILVMLGFALSWIPDAMEQDRAPPPGQVMAPQGYPPAADMGAYRAWQDAYRYNQGVIDETFKSNRDSFDRQLKSYGDATYDWKSKD